MASFSLGSLSLVIFFAVLHFARARDGTARIESRVLAEAVALALVVLFLAAVLSFAHALMS
jgi:hypothetical protein